MASLRQTQHSIEITFPFENDPLEDRLPTKRNKVSAATIIAFPLLAVALSLFLLIQGHEKLYFPVLLTLCALFLVIFSVRHILPAREKYFKLDMTTETLTWYEQYGKKKTRKYVKEIDFIGFTLRHEILPSDKGDVRTITSYEVSARDKKEEDHIILRDSDENKARTIAQALAEMMNRPVMEREKENTFQP